jgi:hypothetical protein
VDKSFAELELKWVSNEGLDGNHTTLIQFDNERGNCSKVVGVLKDIVDQIHRETPSPEHPNLPRAEIRLPARCSSSCAPSLDSNSSGLRILSLGK